MRSSVLFSAASTLLAAAAFAQPANDNCSSATVMSGFGQFAYDTNASTTDGPAISCGTTTLYNDVWYLWTATATGSVKADVCGASFDTMMAVYDAAGGCPTGGEILCNDDSSCGLSSTLIFEVTAGQTYLIRIGAYGQNGFGAGTLNIADYVPPPPHVIYGPVVYEGNGHTYYLLESSSWTQAEEWAVELGGHLATIRNVDEHSFVFFNVMQGDGPNFRRGWIGLNDFGRAEGDYVWTSGEPVDFTYWGSGEPNHANGTEFYAQIPWFAAGAWNDNSDMPGDDPTYGIVEIIPNNPPACPGDLGMAGGQPGQDGQLDNNDFIAFITYFFNHDTHADLGVSGGLPGSDGAYDNNDFIAFINLFFAGCGA